MTFKVQLDSPRVVPGEYVTGKIVMNHSEQKHIRGLIIECYGKEKTRWKQGKSTVQGERLIYHAEIRPEEAGVLPAGQRVYPFSFPLHADLPATFHGENYGSIKYKVKAKLDIIMEIDDTDVEEFLVLSKIDLNVKYPELNRATTFTEVKEISDWGCAGDTSITLDLKLRKRAFALGELIEMIMFCDNTSDVAILNFDIDLKWTTTYRAGGGCDGEYHTRKEKSVISSLRGNGVSARDSKTYQLNFGVPTNFGLPNFSGCELFLSKCKLQVTGITDGLHYNLKLKAPIVLGHVGFRSSRRPSPVNLAPLESAVPYIPVAMPMPPEDFSFGATAPSAPRDDMPAMAPPYPGYSTFPSSESSLPPPSYDEAMARNNK